MIRSSEAVSISQAVATRRFGLHINRSRFVVLSIDLNHGFLQDIGSVKTVAAEDAVFP